VAQVAQVGGAKFFFNSGDATRFARRMQAAGYFTPSSLSVSGAMQERGKPTSPNLRYRVWFLRHNRHNGKTSWEVYTATNSPDRAQRVVNTLERIGFLAYYEVVR
jgi:hypothetical protein